MLSMRKLSQLFNNVNINCLYKQTIPGSCTLLQNANTPNLTHNFHTTSINNKRRIHREWKKKYERKWLAPPAYTLTPYSCVWPLADTVPVQIPQVSEEDKLEMAVYNEINHQLKTETHSRLFAVVHICGKQFKVTDNDIIIVEGYWPPNPGDRLKLEKVLLVGGTDFTLVGRPIVNNELVNVTATVIEKMFSNTKYSFYFKQRKQYRRLRLSRIQQTMLRINSIIINAPIDQKKEVEGLDRVY